MSDKKIKALEKALAEEKLAKKNVEKNLESKTLEITHLSSQLKETNTALDDLKAQKSSNLKGIYRNIVDAYCVADLYGNILEMNEETVNLFGLNSTNEYLNLASFLHPDDITLAYDAFDDLKRFGEFKNFKARIVSRNNTTKHIHINASLIFNDLGKPIAMQGIVRDITKEQILNENLIKSEKRFKMLLENLDTGILLEDKNRKIILTNKKFCDIFSSPLSVDELVGQDCSNMPEQFKSIFKDSNYIVSQIHELISNKKELLAEELKLQNGKVLQRDYIPIFNDTTFIGHLWSYKDITAEKQAQQNLVESENNLKILIQNLDHGIFMEDENNIAILTNKKLCEQLYITTAPDLIPGKDFSQSIHETKKLFKEPDAFYKRYNELIKAQKPVKGEEIRMIDGKVLERNYIPIFKDNVFKGHLWSFNDVTLHRNYNESLEIEKQKYRNIITNTNLGLSEVDLEGKILMVNQSFSNITGFSQDELIGLNARDVLPINKNFALQKTDETRRGKLTSFELKIKDKLGNIKTCLISSSPNYNITGEITGTISVLLDITALKTLEKQKEQLLENLEKSNNELQEYAHIVSHDLKSPLRSIFALVSWIKEDNKNQLDDASLENMALIESTLEKMEQLITDILSYSSVSFEVNENQLINLNDIIADLRQILYIPNHITLSVLNKLPVIEGDRVRLQQLFQNLISNAIRYTDKEEGLIEIDVENKKSYYLFSIKDNGIGIDKKYHKKIFKIFRSLSNHKNSSGIGLSIVKKIIDTYEGKIWLESNVGQGTTFYFTLKK